MSYFKEIDFDRNFAPELQALRKNKELIRFIKADIKKRAKNQTAWKNGYKDVQRGKKFWQSLDNTKCTPKVLMRHIFLAYAWLRFKPLWMTESNAKDVKTDWVNVLGKTYRFTPSHKLVQDVIVWYAKKATVDIKAEEEEQIVQTEDTRWGESASRRVI